MTNTLDEFDRKILRAVQRDSSLSMDKLAEVAGLSRNACWRRLRQLEDSGVIRARVALVDPDRAGLSLQAIVLVRSATHDREAAHV